jgi:hypothetical protein
MGGRTSYPDRVEQLRREISTTESKVSALQGMVHDRYERGRRDWQRQQLHRTGVKLKPGYGAPVVIRSKNRPAGG